MIMWLAEIEQTCTVQNNDALIVISLIGELDNFKNSCS